MTDKVLYRIVKYEGDENWLDSQMIRSMPTGEKILPCGKITIAVIDPDDQISIHIFQDKFCQFVAQASSSKDEGFV